MNEQKLNYILSNIKIALEYKHVKDRIYHLMEQGYRVKRCYIPTYNGVGNVTYMPKLKEFRIIIGRPKRHFCREVYAVIIKE